MNFKKIIQIFILILLFPFTHFGQIESFEYRSEKIRKKILKIAQKIAEEDIIDSKVVGFELERTKQYDRFIKLVKKTTMKELVELTKHSNSSVRGYSFWGLAKRHYDNLETIFIKHANDEENVLFMYACSLMDITVIEFMSEVVVSNDFDVDCKKLSDSAINKMRIERKVLKKKEAEH